MHHNLRLVGQEEALQAIHKEHADLFFIGEEIWKKATVFLQDKARIGVKKSGHLNLCLAAVYAKQLKLYWSIYTNCYYGLAPEAQLPLRAMYEVQLNLLYLQKHSDSAEVSRKWIAWDFANTSRRANEEVYGPNFTRGEVLDNLKAIMDEERAKFTDAEWDKFVRYGPSMLNLYMLSEKVGMLGAHKKFYWYVSGPGHGYDLLTHAQRTGEEDINVNLAPSEKMVDTVLVTAIVMIRDCLVIINNLLDLKKDSLMEEIDALSQKARSLKSRFEVNK